jgi:hypothetical protein
MKKLDLYDPKVIGTLITAFGLAAGAGVGVVSFTTPEAQEYLTQLREVEKKLAAAEARLELLTEAKDACKDALDYCSGK